MHTHIMIHTCMVYIRDRLRKSLQASWVVETTSTLFCVRIIFSPAYLVLRINCDLHLAGVKVIVASADLAGGFNWFSRAILAVAGQYDTVDTDAVQGIHLTCPVASNILQQVIFNYASWSCFRPIECGNQLVWQPDDLYHAIAVTNYTYIYIYKCGLYIS